MKKSYLAALLATCALSASLFGGARVEPCEFSVTGEWVYLHPVIPNPYYVLADTNASSLPNGERKKNSLNYHSGFRIGSMYGFENGCTDLSASWVSLRTSDTATTRGDNLFITQTQQPTSPNAIDGFVSSKEDVDLDRVELLYGFRLLRDCRCFNLTMEVGFQYSNVKEATLITGIDSNGDDAYISRNTQEFWGIGPQFGVDFEYNIWECLAFVGRANAALLLGDANSRISIDRIAGGVLNDVMRPHNEAVWWIVPSFQVRAGFNYDFNLCWDFTLAAGYEYLSFVGALDQIEYTFASNSFDDYKNISFHGPFVSLTTTF